jgi:hypothetical protein
LRNSILEGSLKIELKTIAGPALDHGHGGVGSTGELNSIELDIVSLESMTKSDEVDSMGISFLFNRFEPVAVI